RVSVKDQAERIALRLRNGAKTFSELVLDQPKSVIVASFLAVLELYRQNAVKITQEQGESMVVELLKIPAISEQIGDEYE
ncbi:MAG TPA: segregation/condensation protein A, partial [Microbacteriaceae bacterium]